MRRAAPSELRWPSRRSAWRGGLPAARRQRRSLHMVSTERRSRSASKVRWRSLRAGRENGPAGLARSRGPSLRTHLPRLRHRGASVAAVRPASATGLSLQARRHGGVVDSIERAHHPLPRRPRAGPRAAAGASRSARRSLARPPDRLLPARSPAQLAPRFPRGADATGPPELAARLVARRRAAALADGRDGDAALALLAAPLRPEATGAASP